MALTFLEKINKASQAECHDHKKIRLITLMLAGAGTLFALSEYSSVTVDSTDGTSTVYASFDGYFGVVLLFMAAALGFVTVFSVFKDMLSKQVADVQLSLPMSSLERYCSKLLTLIKLNLLPVAGGAAVITFLGTCITRGWSSMPELINIFWVMLDLDIFAMAMAIFCTVCCGAKAESRYTTVIAGGLVSFLPFAFYELILSSYSGVSTVTDMDEAYSFMYFGGMIFAALAEEGLWGYLLVNLLASCALIFASYFIYRSRDARSVGKPMVFTLFTELFMFAGVFMIYVIFLSADNWAICMVVSLITYMVIRIVAARGKLNAGTFMTWIGKYALAVIAFFAIAMTGYTTGGFGYYRTKADVSHPEKDHLYYEIRVSIADTDDPSGRSSEYSLHGFDNAGADIKGAQEVIDKAYDISGRSPGNFWNFSNNRYYYGSFSTPYRDGRYLVDVYIVEAWEMKSTDGKTTHTRTKTLLDKSFYTNTSPDQLSNELNAKGVDGGRVTNSWDDDVYDYYGDGDYEEDDWDQYSYDEENWAY